MNIFSFIIIMSIGLVTSMFSNFEIPKSEQAVNKLISKAEKYLTQKYEMRAIGTIISMPGGGVRELGLSFQIEGPLLKDKLRNIIVSSAQDFLFIVSKDQEVKPYLKKYPFEINNIQVNLFIIDSQGYSVTQPNIAIVSLNQGDIDYWTYESNDSLNKAIDTETYEEALRLLNESCESQKETRLGYN